jgi:hypothetical protein
MKTTITIALLAAIGCGGTPNPPPPSKMPDGSKANCQTAFENLQVIGSDLATPTPEGATFVEVCINAQSTPAARLDVRCLTLAKTKEEADDC